jgi:hypothetical protein
MNETLARSERYQIMHICGSDFRSGDDCVACVLAVVRLWVFIRLGPRELVSSGRELKSEAEKAA